MEAPALLKTKMSKTGRSLPVLSFCVWGKGPLERLRFEVVLLINIFQEYLIMER